jgi:hypothetical protein
MSDGGEPDESPLEEEFRYTKPETPQYRKVASVGALLFLVCAALMYVSEWMRWNAKAWMSGSICDAIVCCGVLLLGITAAITLCSLWLQRCHDQDDGNSDL